jgi:hypothetical protein
MQTGVASIDQCATFTDRTPMCLLNSSGQVAVGGNPFSSFSKTEHGKLSPVLTSTWQYAILRKISTDLMSKLDTICSSTEINYSLCNFRDTSMEDLYGELFWRYPAQINKDAGEEYPKFLFIPFFAVGGSYAVAKCKNVSPLFSLPFGSNGHSSGRFRGGFSLDFYDTLEIDFEGGVTIFKSRCYCNLPMPNNNYQSQLYPFRADAKVCPGKNWHLALGMNAHNFWYNWCASCHYIYINHDQDSINLIHENYAAPLDADRKTICYNQIIDGKSVRVCHPNCRTNINPYKPTVLECMSKWSMQMLNCTLSYGISPDFYLGGLIQFPIKAKNAYRPTTFMASLFIAV